MEQLKSFFTEGCHSNIFSMELGGAGGRGRSTGEMQWTMECNIVDFQGRNKKFKRNGGKGKDQTAEYSDYFSFAYVWSPLAHNNLQKT